MLIAVMGLLTGCVSASHEGDAIRVVRNPNDVATCRSLGQIQATSGWGGFLRMQVWRTTSTRNEAASRGGDTLSILGERPTLAPKTFGEVYRCTK